MSVAVQTMSSASSQFQCCPVCRPRATDHVRQSTAARGRSAIVKCNRTALHLAEAHGKSDIKTENLGRGGPPQSFMRQANALGYELRNVKCFQALRRHSYTANKVSQRLFLHSCSFLNSDSRAFAVHVQGCNQQSHCLNINFAAYNPTIV